MKRYLVAGLLLTGLLGLAPAAKSQLVPQYPSSGYFTNTASAYLSNGTAVIPSIVCPINSDGVPLYRTRGLNVSVYGAYTNVTCSNNTPSVTLSFVPGLIYGSVTNWMSTPVFNWTYDTNSTTWACTNINALAGFTVDNVHLLRLVSLTNNARGVTNTYFVSNVVWSVFQ